MVSGSSRLVGTRRGQDGCSTPESEVSHAGELLEVLAADRAHRQRRVVRWSSVARGLQAASSPISRGASASLRLLRESPVAYCLPCNEKYRFTELAADMLGSSRTNVCPRCRRDLTEEVRAHLFRCMMLPTEVRLRAQAVREAAQRLVKQAHQACDRADVLISEAEALLFERQRALRDAMSRRTAS